MARSPDQLTLARHRDLDGRENRPYIRWALLTALGLFLLSGLGNAFGQRPETARATAHGAALEVYSPDHLRSGLYFMARFTIRAERELREATLVLDPGWLEAITMNTVAPAPVGEANRNGKLSFDLGRIPAGTKHVLFVHFQVNPTNLGVRSQDVALYDGERPIVRVERTVKVFP
jgi:hypothetical protein